MPINATPGSNSDQQRNEDELDTGTGGFPAHDGARHSYDIGVDDGSKIQNIPWSPGRVNVDDSKKDISSATKSTLASYLSKTTLGKTSSAPSQVKNAYSVQHDDGTQVKTISLLDEKGYPQRAADIPAEQPHFANLGQGRSHAATELNILRGREPSTTAAFDGNTLLNTGDSAGTPAPPVKKYYSKVMSANRFSPDENYSTTEGINSKQFAKRYPMGESLPPEDPRRDVTFGRLAQVGNVLSLRASQELNSLQEEFNPNDFQAAAGALAPGKAQLGVEKISAVNLTAGSVIEDLTKLGIGDELLINPAGESWGSLNNTQDQFAGVSAQGMKLLVTALVVAFSLVVIIMSQLLTLMPSGDQVEKMDKMQRLPLGSSSAFGPKVDRGIGSVIAGAMLGTFNIWKILGVSPTDNPVDVCISVGALSFFGIEYTSTSPIMMTLDASTGSALSVESAGYYTVAARSILRSFIQISEMFSSVGKAFSSNPLAGINKIITIKDALTSSRFMKVLGVFAGIGNNVLAMKLIKDQKSIGDHPRYLSKIDDEPNESGGKSRIKSDESVKVPTKTLSWTSYRARDMFIMPSSMKNFIKDFSVVGSTPAWKTSLYEMQGAIKTPPEEAARDGEGNMYEGIYIDEASRINTNIREAIEESLEAEYVPFYIHDVRTNEIISFHAFLASLSDDYTANYDSAEGIGRVETIKIYKSTNRKIGFSFYLAATSEVDFDAMWLKINKLTTLVYPQFSQGRQITADKNTMRMPFSQIIQASPLVRVRIGDLIKSNYSKFALSRLFGLNDPASVVNGENFSLPSEKPPKKADFFKVGYTFKPKNLDSIAVLGSLTYDFYNNVKVWPQSIMLKITSIDETASPRTAKCEIVLVKEKNDPRTKSVIRQEWGKNSPNAPWKRIIGIEDVEIFLIESLLTPSDETVTLINAEQKKNDEAANAYMTNVGDFMTDVGKEKGNAIVKSFRSSGGKGLAGFIDSMNFDWYDKVTWEIDAGKKAPKMCKVTISFTPVHDITPGLDSDGFNRAPIYGVNDNKYKYNKK